MVIRTYLKASVLFFLFYRLRIKFILHSIKHNGSVIFVVFLGLCDKVADLWLHKCETVIEPWFDEVIKLWVGYLRVLNNILSFD